MAMNLTLRPPRSPRTRLGGFVLLPRIFDKCRAELAGTQGEFHYDCPMDQHFLNFTGIEAAKLKEEVARGGGDSAILAWIMEHSPRTRSAWEIAQWSTWQEARVPSDNETREFYNEQTAKAGGAAREDIATWFDYLDLDDFTTFGGQA